MHRDRVTNVDPRILVDVPAFLRLSSRNSVSVTVGLCVVYLRRVSSDVPSGVS